MFAPFFEKPPKMIFRKSTDNWAQKETPTHTQKQNDNCAQKSLETIIRKAKTKLASLITPTWPPW